MDYLLKPFSSDRLQESAGAGALETRRTCAGDAANFSDGVVSRGARSGTEAGANGGEGWREGPHYPLEKLDYVEAQDDYVALRSEKKNYLKQQTISSVEAQLDPKKFVRIHRSYIVNLERIARIEPYTKDSRVAVLNDGTQLPVSRSGHARLKELLGEVG